MEQLESGNAVLQTIHASEGGRALKLLQQRQKRQQELENVKHSIENESTKRKVFDIDAKYKGSTTEALEEAFKQETVGLVSAEEFREKRRKLNTLLEEREKRKIEQIPEKPRRKNRISKAVLSFASEEEDEEDDEASGPFGCVEQFSSLPFVDQGEGKGEVHEQHSENPKHSDEEFRLVGENEGESETRMELNGSTSFSFKRSKGLRKDPTVDTEFLHDREREARRAEERGRLIQEYVEMENKSKGEILEVTYSYWDGSGHRRMVRVPKGATVGVFLRECQKGLEKEFPELRGVSVDNLLYIKEDLILPHALTFYELIKNKAKGKSGPLFHFDVHEDVRFMNDARVEKDESHAGKIVDRKWYERNKHIFPASRWEVYDPSKTFDKYTIHGHKDFSSEIPKQ